ncbi:MAG TPA: hypothetical protein VJT71_16645 [Pyrinomonadaceae bacterium]|nr:hypothetical protein [Pyrinomonadaceae bacterium]
MGFAQTTRCQTSIVVYRDTQQLVIGADSRRGEKEIRLGTVVSDRAVTITKIQRIEGVAVAIAGSYTFEPREIAIQSFKGHSSIFEKASAFQEALRQPLQDMIENFVKPLLLNGQITIHPERPILQVIVAGFERGTPSYVVFEFYTVQSGLFMPNLIAPTLTLRENVFRCPGDCNKDRSYYAIGRSEAINVTSPIINDLRFWEAFGPSDGVRALISIEINAAPEEVGPPIDIVRMTKDIWCWAEPKTKKESDDPDIKPCNAFPTRKTRPKRSSR